MNQHLTPSAPVDHAAQAFEGLRQEVALLHAAMQGLIAEREKVPDYSPTLAVHARKLDAVLDSIARMAQAPTIALTPVALVSELNQAAVDARSEDRRLIEEARSTLHQSIGRIDHLAERARSTDRQRKRELRIGGSAFMAGILLWSVLPGMIARVLPAIWHVPEWMAERMLQG